MAVVFISAPAQAERKSGLAYTTMGYTVVNPPEKTSNAIEPSQMSALEKFRAEQAAEAKKAAGPIVEDKVWTKYRRLAAGEPDSNTPKPAQPAQPAAAPRKARPASNAGMAGIIQQWKESKQRRAQVRSLTMTQPAAGK